MRWEKESLLTASLGPDGCVETRVWFFYGLGVECDSHRVAMVAAVVAHLFSQRWCNLTPSFLRSEAENLTCRCSCPEMLLLALCIMLG